MLVESSSVETHTVGENAANAFAANTSETIAVAAATTGRMRATDHRGAPPACCSNDIVFSSPRRPSPGVQKCIKMAAYTSNAPFVSTTTQVSMMVETLIRSHCWYPDENPRS